MLKKDKPISQKIAELERYGPEDADYFRGIILEKRKHVLAKVDLLTESTRTAVQEGNNDNSTYSLHMADQGTDAQEREKTFLFASREGRYLQYLNRALVMIEEGGYGVCTDCDQAIQKKRLELVPTARLCIDCKLTEEKRRPR